MRRTQRLHLLAFLFIFFSFVKPLCANTVTEWNAFALANFTPPHGDLLELERALAMTQIAIYEASNAVQPVYRAVCPRCAERVRRKPGRRDRRSRLSKPHRTRFVIRRHL